MQSAIGTVQRPEPRSNPWTRAIERFVDRHRNKLVWIRVAMFFGFMALMVVPVLLPLPPDGARFYNNFTLFANFVIWGLWFPLVFVSVIFTGRSWCGVLCPLGACSEWANRVGLKRPVPAWVRWQGTPVVSFMVITILAQTVDARGFAQGIAVVFGLAFACAIVLGFVYGPGKSQRAWCRHMCPIGLMLGVFSRIGAADLEQTLQWNARYPAPDRAGRPGAQGWAGRAGGRRSRDPSRRLPRACCTTPRARG